MQKTLKGPKDKSQPAKSTAAVTVAAPSAGARHVLDHSDGEEGELLNEVAVPAPATQAPTPATWGHKSNAVELNTSCRQNGGSQITSPTPKP